MRSPAVSFAAAVRTAVTGSPSLLLAALIIGSAYAPVAPPPPAPHPGLLVASPSPDPRVGLRAGLFDAGEATWNLRVVSSTTPPEEFVGVPATDLAFSGDYVIQGSFGGFQIWDVSEPARPELVTVHVCPGSQGDVSVHGRLLFVSVEGLESRLDCGTQGVPDAVSADRLRGIRIFDISDVRRPEIVASVQTCRGSHTHTLLEDPNDSGTVYIYVSGTTPLRPTEEMAGCSGAPPAEDPNSAVSRIEVIRVPLDRPEEAAIVSTPRFLHDLLAPPRHGPTPEDRAVIEAARARGEFIGSILGEEFVIPPEATEPMLAGMVAARGGTGAPTAADSAALREAIPAMLAANMGELASDSPPMLCHDITVYPAIGLAGAACLGYGILLDIADPANPKRLAAVADSNFVAWHSATFNNDGTAVVFTDEWGFGGTPKCRASDPMEWGANAIYTVADGQLRFRGYYKMPAAQTPEENCVAHNGSLIPIPGRDVMVQAWYQGGISVFDFTDPNNPFEIAFHDRGPVDSTELVFGGSWSAYWYNGYIVSSEILRGLDILELTPSAHLSANEIEAAASVSFDQLNVQAQPRFVWPASFALARAYVDQLERAGGLSSPQIASVRRSLADAERAPGSVRRQTLDQLATQLDADAAGSGDPQKTGRLASVLRELALPGSASGDDLELAADAYVR
jgi:hypothetical protein